MNNKERLELVKSLRDEIKNLEEAKLKIAKDIKTKKATLEDITNNIINKLLHEENKK